MPDTRELSEAKRALLEKYLRGELPQAKKASVAVSKNTDTEVGGPHERIVAMQTKGDKRPFFFLHGDWTNSSFFCLSLARELGEERPFYSLDPYGFEDQPVLPSLEEMAAAHIKSMRIVQPEGPYLLGGFCNGGLTAYEMARQLHAAGQKVGALVLMDSIPPRLTMLYHLFNFAGKILHVREEKRLNLFLRLQHAYRYARERTVEDFEYLKTIDPRIDSLFPPIETLRKGYPAMFIWSTAGYEATTYPGKVTLLWDEAEPERMRWWNKWAKNKDGVVENHIIPGTHATCKTTHISGMSECLRECLNKASVDMMS